MKFANCLRLPRCSNNCNSISSFVSSHRDLSYLPMKWFFVYHFVCVCVWLGNANIWELRAAIIHSYVLYWMKLTLWRIFVLFIFHCIIVSTLLYGCGPWNSINIPLYLHPSLTARERHRVRCFFMVITHRSAMFHLGNLPQQVIRKSASTLSALRHHWWIKLFVLLGLVCKKIAYLFSVLPVGFGNAAKICRVSALSE